MKGAQIRWRIAKSLRLTSVNQGRRASSWLFFNNYPSLNHEWCQKVRRRFTVVNLYKQKTQLKKNENAWRCRTGSKSFSLSLRKETQRAREKPRWNAWLLIINNGNTFQREPTSCLHYGECNAFMQLTDWLTSTFFLFFLFLRFLSYFTDFTP